MSLPLTCIPTAVMNVQQSEVWRERVRDEMKATRTHFMEEKNARSMTASDMEELFSPENSLPSPSRMSEARFSSTFFSTSGRNKFDMGAVTTDEVNENIQFLIGNRNGTFNSPNRYLTTSSAQHCNQRSASRDLFERPRAENFRRKEEFVRVI